VARRDPLQLIFTAIGWAASAILVVTIVYQVWRQWHTGASEGVSRWLFVGEILASIGFVVYSAHVGNLVFVVTNSVLLLAAMAGLGIVLFQRKEDDGPDRISDPG
jgi:MtN3 and saliva related transmembrane protein